MTQIRFGTDGWRDLLSGGFNFENVRIMAQAHAQAILKHGGRRVVIGFDTRIASDRFAQLVADVMASNGLEKLMSTQYLPTPALSYAVVHHQADAGVMITASHNPAAYNGYKVKGAYGGSATPDLIHRIETELSEVRRIANNPRQAIERFDIRPAYHAQLERLLDLDMIARFTGDFYHNAMGGSGCGWFEGFIKQYRLPLRFHAVLNKPHALFYGLNPEPIPQNLRDRSYLTSTDPLAFVAVTDGDSDRLGVLLHDGEFFNAHQILAVLLNHLHAKGYHGRVVKTVSSSQMIDVLAARRGLELLETPIGFKHITAAFLEGELDAQRKVMLAGEESGGFASVGHIPERDGLLHGLLLLESIASSGLSLGQQFRALEQETGISHAYDRLDLPLDPSVDKDRLMQSLLQGSSIAGRKVMAVSDKDGVKWQLDGYAWVLFRFSGTEPIARLYCEAEDPKMVQRILREAQERVSLQPV
jgi:phosphomannomutase